MWPRHPSSLVSSVCTVTAVCLLLPSRCIPAELPLRAAVILSRLRARLQALRRAGAGKRRSVDLPMCCRAAPPRPRRVAPTDWGR